MLQPEPAPNTPSLLLDENRNCWKKSRARRVSILIDAERYYGQVARALAHARESVVIIAWDIDPRAVLVFDPKNPLRNVTLGDAMLAAVERNPRLQIHILCWDFSWFYVFERQLLPALSAVYRHPRIHFRTDNGHAVAASHHQKLVLVDGALAFIGGLDLCLRRWDTREHDPWDRRRQDPFGNDYHPFHDLQAMLDGEAVRSLCELARERWKVATGEALPIPEAGAHPAFWPQDATADFENVEVAISRTAWSAGLDPRVREIEAFNLDSIRAARRHVYIESQYFTSRRIADAICERLRAPDCPEFLIVLPQLNSGWKEQVTMGAIRLGVMGKILSCDTRGRVRFRYPVVDRSPISLHSKLMIVDDEILHLGSANLSSRSMGLDTECDLAVVAHGDPAASRAVSRIRSELIAEHTGALPQHVDDLTRRSGSLFSVLDCLPRDSSRRRSLAAFEMDARYPDDPGTLCELIDPERPLGDVLQRLITRSFQSRP